MRFIDQRNVCLAYQYLNNGVHPSSRELPLRKNYHSTLDIAVLLDCTIRTIADHIKRGAFSDVILYGRRFLIPDKSYISFFRKRYKGFAGADFDEIAYEGVLKISHLTGLLGCHRTAVYHYTGTKKQSAVHVSKRLPFVDVGVDRRSTFRFPWRTTIEFLVRELPEGYLERMRNHGRILT